MNIVVTKCSEGTGYFANIFGSNNVLMSRLSVTEEFAQLSIQEQYAELKEKHPDIMKRIR